MRKLGTQVGHQIDEDALSPELRQAISNMAAVQRHLSIIEEVMRAEDGRIERNALLKLTSRVHKDGQREVQADEIAKIHSELDVKVAEVSTRIMKEDAARASGTPVAARTPEVKAVQLKCPSCSADLPMPTGRFMTCQYCGTAISIQDVGEQMRTAIHGI